MNPLPHLALTIAFVAPATAAARKAETDCPMHQAHTAPPAAPAAAEAQALHDPAHHNHVMSPYAGREGAEIKALSGDDLKAYREGTGMGLAKPAELNHYPGPRHVLDLGSELGLTAAQTADLQAVFDRMHTVAVALGERIIAKEKDLDGEFVSGAIDEARLAALTSGIGALQAELRTVHLKAHLETKRILTAQQVARYDSLRGYTGPPRS